MKNFDEDVIIRRLSQSDTSALAQLFDEYQNAFINWVVRDFSVSREQARDIYSDSILDFYDNVTKGKYQKHKGISLKTYIFDIGKYKLLNLNKKQEVHKAKQNDIIQRTEEGAIINPENSQHIDEQAEIVKQMLNMLCDQCREILRLFYYHNATMQTIADKLGFANTDVAKTEKYQCLQELKELVKKRYQKSDFF